MREKLAEWAYDLERGKFRAINTLYCRNWDSLPEHEPIARANVLAIRERYRQKADEILAIFRADTTDKQLTVHYEAGRQAMKKEVAKIILGYEKEAQDRLTSFVDDEKGTVIHSGCIAYWSGKLAALDNITARMEVE